MSLINRFYISALVMIWALFPPRTGSEELRGTAAEGHSAERLAGNREIVRFYMADLSRALDSRRELKIIFPGCFVFAAPLLLFRLKRWGFSNGRALMTADGLFLAASR